jgi:hypothetical protein
VPKEFDPMAETDKTFYDIVNNQPGEWITSIEQNPIDFEFSPHYVEYHMPGPIPGVFIRVSMNIQLPEEMLNINQFMVSLSEYLNDEDEKYGS